MKLPKLEERIIRIMELSYAVLLLAWFFLPFALGKPGALVPGRLGSQLGLTGLGGGLLTALAWLVPLVALWRIAFFFVEKLMPPILARKSPLSLLLGFLASGIVLGSHVLHVLAFASKAAYFANVGIFAWFVLALSLGYNAYVFLGLIRLVGSRDKSRQELQAFKSERETSPDAKVYAGIQRRLLVSFLALITLVIVIICAILLRDFSTTLLSSVIANGESIVDRTASMAKSSPGDGKDHISREDYLRDEANKNKKAIFPFNNLTYYRNVTRGAAASETKSVSGDTKAAPSAAKSTAAVTTGAKTTTTGAKAATTGTKTATTGTKTATTGTKPATADTKSSSSGTKTAAAETKPATTEAKPAPTDTKSPSPGTKAANTDTFVALESTLPSLVGKKVSADPESVKVTGWRASADGKRIEFISPVTLSGQILGYVSADYDQDVIYEPYFRTQTKVFIVAFLFIYLSIFLTYFLGRAIVLPLLFLNMSVNRISQTLSGMIGGRIKIAANLLTYEDHVKTKDEIKGLSVEIGDMTTVIRGVVPYISASTLKYADRATPTSEARDLAFLFTDIRGFTTLCEGRSPAEVVELLNHYLALQSSLILENGGDIDKFVGDEVMAMFEGPDKELNACKAGMAIRKAMAKEKELALAAKQHVVAIGIGINTGPVTFGSVGAQNRMDFTSIGDTVNLAARLEGANKPYGTKTLITEAVWEKINKQFLCREIDLMTVKGKAKPVRIYEMLREKDEVNAALSSLVKGFEAGLAAYRAQDWATATDFFKKIVADYKDETSSVFLARIAHFKRTPPPQDWDGVFNLSEK